jgi:hypothetical protein
MDGLHRYGPSAYTKFTGRRWLVACLEAFLDSFDRLGGMREVRGEGRGANGAAALDAAHGGGASAPSQLTLQEATS